MSPEEEDQTMSGTPPPLDMKAILTDRSNRVVVCCGAGGVGKTTTAAAMALRAAEYGRSVVVLTIDPAKRLAQALGIKELGNEPQRVQLGDGATGELHAMMLDMRRTFDEMVIEHSGPERAQAILDNQFYQTVATSLAGTQEYMAMEKLGQLLSQDRWDLVVVDTPPSRNALDFLDAPKRLGSFMDGRLWRLLLAPGRGIGRLVTGVMGLAMKAISTILGSQMLSDASALRAVPGLHLRRLPREGGPNLRTPQTPRHTIRGGLSRRTGCAAGSHVLRRPTLRRGDAACGPGPEPHSSDAVRSDRRTRHRRGG
jgi:hypothetical protein